MPRAGGTVQEAARLHAAMLVDPCTCSVEKPAYPGPGGAFVQRAVFDYTPTNGFMAFFFHPLFGAYVIDVSTGGTGGAATQIWFPGGNTTESGRAVAGCMEILWMGSESARLGYVGAAIAPGPEAWRRISTSNLGGGLSDTPLNLMTFTSLSTRMPVDKFAINWIPTVADEQIVATAQTLNSSSQFSSIVGDYNFAMMVVLNTTASGVRVRFTAVNEYTTNSSNNTWQPSVPRPNMTGVSQNIVASLYKKDPNWWVDTFRKAGNLLGNAAYAGISYETGGLPGLLGYLATGRPTTAKTPRGLIMS